MRISGFWVALTVLAVLTVGCGQPAQEEKAAEPPAPPTAEEAVEVLVQAWDSAMNAGDAAAAAALYVSDNPAIMPPEMPAREGG
jgi:hypothetical protein